MDFVCNRKSIEDTGERERDGCNNHQQDYETSQDENGSHSDVLAFVAISLNDNFKTAGTTMTKPTPCRYGTVMYY